MQEDEGKLRRLSSEMGCAGGAPCSHCGSNECAADDCAAMGRSNSSASSSDTMLVDAAEGEPEPNMMAPGMEEVLRSHLVCWGQRLVQLQPKVSGRSDVHRGWVAWMACGCIWIRVSLAHCQEHGQWAGPGGARRQGYPVCPFGTQIPDEDLACPPAACCRCT